MTGEPRHPAFFDLPDEEQPMEVTSLAQEASGPVATAEPAPGAPVSRPPLSAPALLDLPEGMPGGRVDHEWAPARLQPRAATAASLHPIVAGVVVLLLGWLVLSALGFVGDQFARSVALGWTTVLVFGAGLLTVLWGTWREVRSFRQLQRVDALRSLLAEDNGPVLPVRALTLEWLGSLEGLPGLAAAREAVGTAADVPLLRAALRRHLAGPLQGATQRVGSQAALQGGLVVAISPSPALDGVLVGLRGLSLLRQVAAIHGMRPGAAVTLALLRRVAWTAAGTSGMDLLGQGLADSALSHLPVIRQIVAALPGSGLTALRLKRLAEVTAQACSPIEEAL